MDPQDLLLTVVRASLVYFFLLVVIRILGKRSIGPTSAFDLLVALMLGEVVDEVIYGDVSLLKGAVVIGVITAWHLVNAYVSYRSKRVDELTSGKPTILVEHGEIKAGNLAKERINENEVYSQLRMQSIDDIQEVKCATLEPSGQISVIQEEWARPVQKGDLPKKKG
jgi:uncharacterized membrane protein YcaP (DUF421 family)